MFKIILLALFTMVQQPKPELIYVGDPMCSWCYGVSEEMAQVKNHFDAKVDFKVVTGGLRPYNTETMADLKDFLTHHWEDVHKASGQKFNYGILDSTDITYDTEPPSRATVVVRRLKPEVEFEFFKAIQRTFYLENKNMHLKESYHDVLKSLSVNTAEFDKLFVSDEMKNLVRQDFTKARRLGVSSFPTLLLKTGEDVHVVARGFSDSASMIAEIDKLLAAAKSN